jgi:hypothetical protein
MVIPLVSLTIIALDLGAHESQNIQAKKTRKRKTINHLSVFFLTDEVSFASTTFVDSEES